MSNKLKRPVTAGSTTGGRGEFSSGGRFTGDAPPISAEQSRKNAETIEGVRITGVGMPGPDAGSTMGGLSARRGPTLTRDQTGSTHPGGHHVTSEPEDVPVPPKPAYIKPHRLKARKPPGLKKAA